MKDIIDDLKTAAEQGIPAVLCIVTSTSGSTPRKAGAKMLVYSDGTLKGSIGGGSIEHQAIQDALETGGCGEPFTRSYQLLDDLGMHCGGTMEVYFEAIGCSPELYIFGGGHIGKALAGFAPALGFRTMVLDQRTGIFDAWHLPGVATRSGEFSALLEGIKFGQNTYIVIVSPQHSSDEELMIACAARPHAYLGMIGSKRKVAEIRKKVLENGLLTTESLNAVDMPIGIPFAAVTPAEIAISILAKLIDVKNTRNPL
jgi:xanthine dehydrogenase accessory factor